MGAFIGFLLAWCFLGAAVWYIASRTAWVLECRKIWLIAIYGVALICSLVAMFAYASPATTGPVMHLLTLFFCYLCAFLVVLLLTLLLVDLVHLVFPFGRFAFGAAVLALSLGLSAYGFIHAASPRVKEVEIPLPGLTREVRAVQLTDVHIGHFRGRKHLQKLVDRVNALDPELIFFTGDFMESWYNCSEEAIAPVRQLKAPVFFVDGNHDSYVDAGLVKEMCRKAGFRVLENEVVEYAGIRIVGLEYMVPDEQTRDNMHAADGKATIRSTMPQMGITPDQPSIVLHHSPVGAEYIAQAGAGLFLAGHTHGGQFFPLTRINDRLFEYNRGLYKRGSTAIYVSCGSGTFGLPLRIGTDSEITALRLTPEKR